MQGLSLCLGLGVGLGVGVGLGLALAYDEIAYDAEHLHLHENEVLALEGACIAYDEIVQEQISLKDTAGCLEQRLNDCMAWQQQSIEEIKEYQADCAQAATKIDTLAASLAAANEQVQQLKNDLKMANAELRVSANALSLQARALDALNAKNEATEKNVEETVTCLPAAAAEQKAEDLSEKAQQKEAELVAEAQKEKEARQAGVTEAKEELEVEEGGAEPDEGALEQVLAHPF
ncbi:hypothetical protein T484DRAFT_1744938 [Baffinella frigidus]|nr:hypothetical protein T484DRAFT_1744938 [Cryptophyta sp. CCMP2293]